VLELLVVISITSVLAALFFPVFASAKIAAKGAACLGNLHQIEVATALYEGDADGRLPYAVAAQTKKYASFAPSRERGPLFKAALQLPRVEELLAIYGADGTVWHCSVDQVEPIFLAENDVLPGALQWQQTYYATVGSSYDFDDVTAILRGGIEPDSQSDQVVFCDYGAVHGPKNLKHSGDRNLLLGDGHVSLDTRGQWGSNFAPISTFDWQ